MGWLKRLMDELELIIDAGVGLWMVNYVVPSGCVCWLSLPVQRQLGHKGTKVSAPVQ